MARYICHQSEWAAMATLAARDPIVGFPFANIFSISDGPVGEFRVQRVNINRRTQLYLACSLRSFDVTTEGSP